MAAEVRSSPLFSSSLEAISLACMLYLLLLGIIVIQNKFLRYANGFRESFLLLLVNAEILVFLLIYHFIFAAHRFYFPLLSQTGLTLISLTLYFGALATFHYSYHTAQRYRKMVSQIRFLAPFVLPFLIFGALEDLVLSIPSASFQQVLHTATSTVLGNVILVGLTLLFLFLLLMVLPPIFIRCWGCSPLQNQSLQEELEEICRRAHFKYAGIKEWTIMKQMPTAAIIGILPRLRYIIFTERLLKECSIPQLQAILAHEIGHNYRKHLLIYPFILLGMTVPPAFFFLAFGESIQNYFASKYISSPSSWWITLYPLAILIPYVVMCGLYFRYIFGFFSRMFERQADLHVFQLEISPDHLIDSLNQLGTMTGNTHKHPSWHHYSIEQRIGFLERAKISPECIRVHHTKVKWILIAYFFVLALSSLFLLLSFLPTTV